MNFGSQLYYRALIELNSNSQTTFLIGIGLIVVLILVVWVDSRSMNQNRSASKAQGDSSRRKYLKMFMGMVLLPIRDIGTQKKNSLKPAGWLQSDRG